MSNEETRKMCNVGREDDEDKDGYAVGRRRGGWMGEEVREGKRKSQRGEKESLVIW